MPTAPGFPPLKPKAAAAPRASTTARGYGTAHQRQRRVILARHPVCQNCSADWSAHLHHDDRDPFNRAESNVLALCEACHIAVHKGRR